MSDISDIKIEPVAAPTPGTSPTLFACPWRYFDVHNSICMSMTLFSCPWICFDVHDSILMSITLFSCPWLYFHFLDSFCMSMTLFACPSLIFMSMTLFACPWLNFHVYLLRTSPCFHFPSCFAVEPLATVSFCVRTCCLYVTRCRRSNISSTSPQLPLSSLSCFSLIPLSFSCFTLLPVSYLYPSSVVCLSLLSSSILPLSFLSCFSLLPLSFIIRHFPHLMSLQWFSLWYPFLFILPSGEEAECQRLNLRAWGWLRTR